MREQGGRSKGREGRVYVHLVTNVVMWLLLILYLFQRLYQ